MRQFCMFGCWKGKAEAGLWEQRLSQIPQVQDESCLANCEDWKKADFNRINSWGWEVQSCLFRHSEWGELSHITICLLSYPEFQQLALIPWGTKNCWQTFSISDFSHKKEHLCLSSIFYTYSIVYIMIDQSLIVSIQCYQLFSDPQGLYYYIMLFWLLNVFIYAPEGQ